VARVTAQGRASRLLLIALLGFDLRAVILAVPPILPAIRSDLGLGYTVTSLLTAVPVVLLGAAAIPGAMLANRYGPRLVIAGCLAALAAGSLLRLAPPRLPWLFAGTVLLATGAAVAQPSASGMLRSWFGAGVERANALYSAGLSTGGLVAATATPALALLLGWPGTFWFWALPVAALLILWVAAARGGTERRPVARLTRVHQLLREPRAWRTAALFGSQSLVFYSTVTWLPFRAAAGGPGVVAISLLGLTSGGLAPSLLLAALRYGYATSRRFYLLGGIALVLGSAAVILSPLEVLWLAAAVLGVGGGMLFAGSMALPAVLAENSAEVPDLTAFVLTAGYAAAFVGPLLGGVLVDATHRVELAFVPGLLAGLLALLLGGAAPWPRHQHGARLSM
jgi:CP family cyanate transporter-like MFS transporter